MPRPRKVRPAIENVELIATALEGFDYEIDREDFVLYEVARLIDEDRASFDEEEFRQVIDDGVRDHIEENLQIRAKLSRTLRLAIQQMLPDTQAMAMRVVRAIEDVHSNLRNVGVIVRNYTHYLFERLQTLADTKDDNGDDGRARDWINRWRNGEIVREDLVTRLKAMSESAVAPAADLLFESPDDRMAAEAAVAVLCGVRSATSARVLAHAVSEPVLDEDLEAKACKGLSAFWPLSRSYMLHELKKHIHEDIPFRWFELFVEVDELSTVELVLDELRTHGNNPDYREDLASLLDVLQKSRDPEIEHKILATMNAPETGEDVRAMLESFLRDYREPDAGSGSRWSLHATQFDLNRKYMAAAKLFDSGKKADALRELEAILAVDPQYPLAVNLRDMGD